MSASNTITRKRKTTRSKLKQNLSQYGVDYKGLDDYKRRSIEGCRSTVHNIEHLGVRFLEETIGDSVQLVEFPDHYLAFVVEGLGTENAAAEQARKDFTRSMGAEWGSRFDEAMAVSNAATAFNDLSTVGADALVHNMYLGVQNTSWFNAPGRVPAVINGQVHACNTMRCVYGGGETPGLDVTIARGTALYAGACVGIIKPKTNWINSRNLQDGDGILLLTSAAFHDNGWTNLRGIAKQLGRPRWRTKLPDGRTFGEATLVATHLYGSFLRRCQEEGIPIHGAENISGHGWRKIMRAPQPFRYEITRIPELSSEFAFVQAKNGMTDEDMYGTFTMGAGYVIFIPEEYIEQAQRIAGKEFPFQAINAGRVCKAKRKSVVIKSKRFKGGKIIFKGESLQLR